jgi:ligand-binding sensor domain-containing protein
MVFMDRDNEGNIWFDTGKGLSRFDGKNWEMVNQDVTNATCFLQDKRGDLWFGAWNHVYRYDGTSWDIFSPDSQTTVTSIVEDHTGNVWISTMNYLYDFDGKSWTTYDVRDYLKITQNNVMINSVTIDSQNTVWAATTNGIVHFDRTNWQIYTTADGLDDDYINAIYQDKSGKIWAYGFYSGLNLFDDSSWQLFLKDDRIVDIAQDDKGNMWLATDHGVTKYDGDTFENYTTADGLPDNSIRKIIMVNGNVWGGTNTGVSYYNGKSWQSITNGLAGIGVYQIVADRSGGIWFGMWGGISRYAPAQGNPSPIHIETKAPASVFADQLIDIAVTPAPVYTLVAGQSCQFIAMGTFFDNMGENITARVTWSSFDTAVAKISVGGLAAGEKAGSTVITASMSAITSPAVTLVVVTPVAAATTP